MLVPERWWGVQGHPVIGSCLGRKSQLLVGGSLTLLEVGDILILDGVAGCIIYIGECLLGIPCGDGLGSNISDIDGFCRQLAIYLRFVFFTGTIMT